MSASEVMEILGEHLGNVVGVDVVNVFTNVEGSTAILRIDGKPHRLTLREEPS